MSVDNSVYRMSKALPVACKYWRFVELYEFWTVLFFDVYQCLSLILFYFKELFCQALFAAGWLRLCVHNFRGRHQFWGRNGDFLRLFKSSQVQAAEQICDNYRF
ncbi:hypothetical protein A1507_15040 [Methylomonas koyamae]|uniref:Uncharacterized protein n=1 Tax=Methylomonas koyamae TaxID=702114 RepID=A0A177N9P5_9GAMM|nr:hypothetical protein A1507_15040 [Methylomonas koyamae]